MSEGRAGNDPSWSQIGATAFSAYKFGLNDECWVVYHIPHSYRAGTDIYFHAHWIADGTNAQNVRWEWTWATAKGYNQGAFDFTGTTVTKDQANGVQYQHQIAEISTPASSVNFEIDGLIMCRIRRITNGATDNADNIFLLIADAHIEVDQIATPNRNYPFT